MRSLGACVGAFVFGLLISGFTVPGKDDMDLVTAVESPSPARCIGLGVVWFIGVRQEQLEDAARGGVAPRR